MVRKSLLLSLSILLMGLVAKAQGPNGSAEYYKPANGKMYKSLKTALFNIIKRDKNNVKSYDGLIDAYRKTDTRPDGYVRDWYSNVTKFTHDKDKAGNYNQEGDCYNREHSIPQSWFSKASPMKSDIVHVIPTDGYVNNRRSSYPFGEVGSITYQSANGYSKLGTCKTSGYSGTVFEPNDEVKGDIARIYFYMATCYEDKITGWSNMSDDKHQPYPAWQMTMLLRWSAADPIDSVELARNDSVYVVQGNRNPFVDYPGLEQMIWGDKTDVAFVYDNYESPSTGGGDSGGGDSGGGDSGGGEGGGDNPSVNPTTGEATFARITSTDDLEVGTSYLIVCESQKKAMSDHDGKNRNNVSVTIDSNKITTTVGESGKPYELVLGGDATNGYTLYDPVAKTYLALTSNSNEINQLEEATTKNALWAISFNQNNAVISSKAYTSRSIKYNESSRIFRTYTSTSDQTAVQLYKNMTSTGINTVVWTYNQKPTTVRVHSLQGVLIRTTSNYVDALKDLPKGFYIINGRKIVIR